MNDYLIFIGMVATTLVFFKQVWVTPSHRRNSAINFSVLVFTCIFLGLLLEFFFSTLMIRSDSFSFTLANQRWFQTYWKPINSLGYRDEEPSKKPSQLILVVGDSFVAGQGITNYRRRFSNLLQEKLGKEWSVLNIAQVGWSTTEEYHAIVTYPNRPTIIILSYFIDDIREAANRSQVKEKFNFTELVKPPPAWLDWLIRRSYFLNFVYWEGYRYKNREPEDIYWQRLRYFYGESDAWRVHQEELTALVEYTKKNQIVLLPIIFPNLISIESSKPIVDKVFHLFQNLGVRSLDLTPYFAQRFPAELVVNRVDAHPNEAVNAQVAEILFKELNNVHP